MSNVEYSYEIQPQCQVLEVFPPQWLECFITIGHNEMILKDFKLPFTGPHELKCRLRLVYPISQLPEQFDPCIFIKDKHSKHYTIHPLEHVVKHNIIPSPHIRRVTPILQLPVSPSIGDQSSPVLLAISARNTPTTKSDKHYPCRCTVGNGPLCTPHIGRMPTCTSSNVPSSRSEVDMDTDSDCDTRSVIQLFSCCGK